MIENAKYLGVQVDKCMSWKNNSYDKKDFKSPGMISYAKNYLPLTTVQIVYTSIIEPYFRFCCPA